MKPSEDNGTFWHYAFAHVLGGFSSRYHRTGKWIIYVPDDRLDDTWETVQRSIEEDQIAPCAKCSTALVNPRQESHGSKIICVYVESFQEEMETKKVLTGLRNAGIKGKLKFKRDAETFDGVYGPNSFWAYSRKGTDIVRYKWNSHAV